MQLRDLVGLRLLLLGHAPRVLRLPRRHDQPFKFHRSFWNGLQNGPAGMCSVVLIVGAVGLVVWALAVPAPAKMMAAIAGPAKQAPIIALVPNRMTIPLW